MAVASLFQRALRRSRPQQVAAIVGAVATIDAFDPDNDPHGEHDFGLIAAARQQVMWKIDYYDRSSVGHSPDPADPAVTNRVLTIMLAEEY